MKRKNDRLPIFTERFRELQGEKSNTEFADFLGISRQTVGFYYNGDRVPDALTLVKISRKCGVSADWLLGLSGEKELNGDITQVCNYTGLSKKAIRNLADLKNSYAGYRSVVADYIISDDELLGTMIEYLSASVWGEVEEDILGMYPPSNEEWEDYEWKKEKYAGSFKVILPPFPDEVIRPDEEFVEDSCFAQAIKKLTRLYDKFKQTHASNTSFVEAVIKQYVKDCKAAHDEWYHNNRQ